MKGRCNRRHENRTLTFQRCDGGASGAVASGGGVGDRAAAGARPGGGERLEQERFGDVEVRATPAEMGKVVLDELAPGADARRFASMPGDPSSARGGAAPGYAAGR